MCSKKINLGMKTGNDASPQESQSQLFLSRLWGTMALLVVIDSEFEFSLHQYRSSLYQTPKLIRPVIPISSHKQFYRPGVTSARVTHTPPHMSDDTHDGIRSGGHVSLWLPEAAL